MKVYLAALTVFINSFFGCSGFGGVVSENYQSINSQDWEFSEKTITDENLVDIKFVNSQFGRIITRKGVPTEPITGTIFTTADGGVSWKKTNLELKKNYTPLAVYFINEKKGWAAAYDDYTNTTQMFETHNAGENWELTDTMSDTRINALLFKKDGKGWLVGKKGQSFGDRKPLVLFTGNFGDSWTVDSSKDILALNDEDEFQDISKVSEEKVMVLSSFGKFLELNTKKGSWELTADIVRRESSIKFRALEDKSFIVLSSFGNFEGTSSTVTKIRKTGEQISHRIVSTELHDLIAISDNELLACGHDVSAGTGDSFFLDTGIIVYSDNNGKTWERIYTKLGVNRSSFWFNGMTKTDDAIFVVGDGGTVVRIKRKSS